MEPKLMLLSEDQERAIRATLQGVEPYEVLIIDDEADMESGKLAFDIQRILKSVGWKADKTSWQDLVSKRASIPKKQVSSLTEFYVGVLNPDNSTREAEYLLAALKAANIPVERRVQAFSWAPQKRTCLVIGVQPLKNRPR